MWREWLLDMHNVVEPAVRLIRTHRLSMVTDASVQGPPDLVIEALSDRTRERDWDAQACLDAPSRCPSTGSSIPTIRPSQCFP